MSEKIVIIGNGFDLRHFLPTKYDHLMSILRVIENFNYDTKSDITFDDLFGTLFKETHSDFYDGITEYYEVSKINFDKDQLKSIRDRVKSNSWFQYLKSIEENRIDTWIDFETEIGRVLLNIVDYFEKFNKKHFQVDLFKRNYFNNLNFYVQQLECEKFFTNRLQFKILVNFNLFLNTKDKKIFQLNNSFALEIDDVLQNYREKEFFDFLYKGLEDFIGIFNDYIFSIVNKFYDNFKEKKKENFVQIKDKFLFDKVSRIYCFNYTNTYLNLYKFKDLIKQMVRMLPEESTFEGIYFLHGKSIENWEHNFEKLQIVLGVNDIDPLLKNHKLFQFTKYFQKLHKGTDYLFLDNIIKSLERKTKGMMDYTFYFWGHSLDISDKEYINDVFKIVIETQSRIKIFYHSISGKADQLKNLLSVISDKNIIEDLMKSGRLQFIESTTENLFKEL